MCRLLTPIWIETDLGGMWLWASGTHRGASENRNKSRGPHEGVSVSLWVYKWVYTWIYLCDSVCEYLWQVPHVGKGRGEGKASGFWGLESGTEQFQREQEIELLQLIMKSSLKFSANKPHRPRSTPPRASFLPVSVAALSWSLRPSAAQEPLSNACSPTSSQGCGASLSQGPFKAHNLPRAVQPKQKGTHMRDLNILLATLKKISKVNF